MYSYVALKSLNNLARNSCSYVHAHDSRFLFYKNTYTCNLQLYLYIYNSCIYDLMSKTSTPVVNFIMHQHFTYNFPYELRFGSFFYVHVTREKLPKQCSYKKIICKMLMKLTPAQQQSTVI